MEKRKSIFDILGQSFLIFGITVTVLVILGKTLGDDASEISTMFLLGSSGVAFSTLLQFLALSFITTLLSNLFFSDIIIKRMPIAIRTAGMFASVIVVIVLMAYLFGWFPLDNVMAWAGFFISFFASAGISAGAMYLKEKSENKKLEDALKRAQE